MFTTAVNLPDAERQRWNNFPSTLLAVGLPGLRGPDDGVPLAGLESSYNFVAGEEPRLAVSPSPVDRSFRLRHPGVLQTRLDVAANASQAAVGPARRSATST